MGTSTTKTSHANLVLARSSMELVKQDIQRLGLPSLGPSFKTIDPSQVQNALVAYRYVKKLSHPGERDSLRRKAINDMLEYDSGGLTSFEPARMEMPKHVRQTLYKTRNRLHEIFNSFHVSGYDLEFPSGESIVPARGNVSLYAKLRKRENWGCTPACLKMFTRIVYVELHLRRCAKQHMRGDGYNCRSKYREFRDAGYSHAKAVFTIFSERFKRIVTLEHGSRIETVPKNAETDRCINVECMGNMIVQRAIASIVKKKLLTHFGIDLEHLQDVHKARLQDPSLATIDLSNASNSNWMCVVKFLLPKALFNALEQSRSCIASYKVEGVENYHHLNMLAPMGNGFTFEIMTLILLSLARHYDEHSSVFGDDIMIKNSVADMYIECIETCGYTVNNSKSFVNSPFRESCGGFYHDQFGYILSYDFWYVEDDVDLMVTTNKLYHLLTVVTGDLKVILSRLYYTLLSCFSPLCFIGAGVIPEHWFVDKTFLTVGVIVPDQYNVKARKKIHSRVEFNKRKLREYRNAFHAHVDYGVLVPRRRNVEWASTPIDRVKSTFLIAYYMYNGYAAKPYIKRPYIQYDKFVVWKHGIFHPL